MGKKSRPKSRSKSGECSGLQINMSRSGPHAPNNHRGGLFQKQRAQAQRSHFRRFMFHPYRNAEYSPHTGFSNPDFRFPNPSARFMARPNLPPNMCSPRHTYRFNIQGINRPTFLQRSKIRREKTTQKTPTLLEDCQRKVIAPEGPAAQVDPEDEKRSRAMRDKAKMIKVMLVKSKYSGQMKSSVLPDTDSTEEQPSSSPLVQSSLGDLEFSSRDWQTIGSGELNEANTDDLVPNPEDEDIVEISVPPPPVVEVIDVDDPGEGTQSGLDVDAQGFPLCPSDSAGTRNSSRSSGESLLVGSPCSDNVDLYTSSAISNNRECLPHTTPISPSTVGSSSSSLSVASAALSSVSFPTISHAGHMNAQCSGSFPNKSPVQSVPPHCSSGIRDCLSSITQPVSFLPRSISSISSTHESNCGRHFQSNSNVSCSNTTPLNRDCPTEFDCISSSSNPASVVNVSSTSVVREDLLAETSVKIDSDQFSSGAGVNVAVTEHAGHSTLMDQHESSAVLDQCSLPERPNLASSNLMAETSSMPEEDESHVLANHTGQKSEGQNSRKSAGSNNQRKSKAPPRVRSAANNLRQECSAHTTGDITAPLESACIDSSPCQPTDSTINCEEIRSSNVSVSVASSSCAPVGRASCGGRKRRRESVPGSSWQHTLRVFRHHVTCIDKEVKQLAVEHASKPAHWNNLYHLSRIEEQLLQQCDQMESHMEALRIEVRRIRQLSRRVGLVRVEMMRRGQDADLADPLVANQVAAMLEGVGIVPDAAPPATVHAGAPLSAAHVPAGLLSRDGAAPVAGEGGSVARDNATTVPPVQRDSHENRAPTHTPAAFSSPHAESAPTTSTDVKREPSGACDNGPHSSAAVVRVRSEHQLNELAEQMGTSAAAVAASQPQLAYLGRLEGVSMSEVLQAAGDSRCALLVQCPGAAVTLTAAAAAAAAASSVSVPPVSGSE